MIRYADSVESITVDQIADGFFDGWPNPPSRDTHMRILRESDYVVVALDGDMDGSAGVDWPSLKVVGFITAITDRVLCAYIPLLEVLPEYKHRGIGSKLVTRMLAKLDDYYMIDISCDSGLQPFYERHNMNPALAMIKRNYHQQTGRPLIE